MLLGEEVGWQAETITLRSVNVKSQAHKAAPGGDRMIIIDIKPA